MNLQFHYGQLILDFESCYEKLILVHAYILKFLLWANILYSPVEATKGESECPVLNVFLGLDFLDFVLSSAKFP
jgi:hypothetical protein